MTVVSQWWSWGLAAVGIVGIWLAGRKMAVGWLVGLAAQVLWLAYAVLTRQWGFLATAVAYAAFYSKNYLSWAGITGRRPVEASEPCVFCDIIAGRAPATVVHRWPDAVAIVPLNPVVDGHLLVIPTTHVRDLTENPEVTGAVARRAAEIASHPCNLITSAGREATQSVWHLHWHIVPRREDDGLALPWYSGRPSRSHR